MGGPRGPGALGAAPRALAAAREALWSFLGGALSADEKSRLAVALYDASTEYRGEDRHAWEDAWLARWLPAAGRAREGAETRERAAAETRERAAAETYERAAETYERAGAETREREGWAPRVLVGAAGAGREVRIVEARGCEVTALEPSRALAALCRARAPGARVIEARYEDVAAGRALAAERFDAALLGLGSLSHVLDGAARASLLRALARACDGPILASALSPPRAQGERVARVGRAAGIGGALARPIRMARRLPEVEAGEVVFGGLGFAKLFTRPELRALGEAAGRRVIFDDGAPDGMELCAFVR